MNTIFKLYIKEQGGKRYVYFDQNSPMFPREEMDKIDKLAGKQICYIGIECLGSLLPNMVNTFSIQMGEDWKIFEEKVLPHLTLVPGKDEKHPARVSFGPIQKDLI